MSDVLFEMFCGGYGEEGVVRDNLVRLLILYVFPLYAVKFFV